MRGALCTPSSRSPERTVRFIPSCSRSSSEFLRSHSRPFPFGIRPPARVSSLFATSPGASTRLEGSQVLDTFRPQVFSTSRRLSPHPASRACFIPQPPPGTSARSGAYLLRAAAAFLIGSELPPCRCSPAALQNESGVHIRRPRLRGLDPRGARTFGWSVVSLPSGRSPLRVSLLQDLFSRRCSRLTQEHPLLKLPDQTFTPAYAFVMACPRPPAAYCQREDWLVRRRPSRPARVF